jgi:hypothetical protein
LEHILLKGPDKARTKYMWILVQQSFLSLHFWALVYA